MTDRSGDDRAETTPTSGGTALGTGCAFCLLSITTIQFGSALSATAVAEFGVPTTTFLRFAIAALVLTVIVRPSFSAFSQVQWGSAMLLGMAMATMTLCVFSAMRLLPLGLLVAIDFLGPLAVATIALRGRQLAWPALALGGVLLLSHDGKAWIGNATGVLFALGAASGWAAYIVLLRRVGNLFRGLDGLAASLVMASVFTAPLGLPHTVEIATPAMIGMMLGLAMLVPLVPYALEAGALRRMPMAAFSILMSLEPAAAALAGLLVLGQPLAPLQVLGTGFVVAASLGVTLAARPTAGAAA